MARWLWAILPFSEVSAWFEAWVDSSWPVVECVWSTEVELLLLVVGEGVVWGTKIRLTPWRSPLIGH